MSKPLVDLVKLSSLGLLGIGLVGMCDNSVGSFFGNRVAFAQTSTDRIPEAPRPQPPDDNPPPPAARKPVAPSPESDLISKKEEALLADQIEINRLLQTLGPDHPKVRQIQDRMKITQDWIAERRKHQKQVALLRIPGRNPKDFIKVLSDLYGDKIKVVVDEKTGTAIVTIPDAKSRSDASDLIGDIERIVQQLQSPAEAATVKKPMIRIEEHHSKTDRTIQELVQRIAGTDAANQPGLLSALQLLVEKQFEQRQQQRATEIDQLRRKLEQFETNYARRQNHKSEIIKRRIQELIDPEAHLQWDDQPIDPPSEDSVDQSSPAPDEGNSALPAPANSNDGASQ